MSISLHEQCSQSLLHHMKDHGFDFTRVHPIDFYAILPDETLARQAAGNFRGESFNTQISQREEGGWVLQVSKVMHASEGCIDDFEQDLASVVAPLGGVLDGWGVTQEIHGRLA